MEKSTPPLLKKWYGNECSLCVNNIYDRLTEIEKLRPGAKNRLLSNLTQEELAELPDRPAHLSKAKKRQRVS